MKIETSVNRDQIEQGESLICTFNILNKSDEDIKNIVLNPFITDGLSFMGGSVKRQRGMMDIHDQYIDLEIGNLAPKEDAIVTIEFKYDKNIGEIVDKGLMEIKCYGVITFNNHKKIEEKVASNIVYAKIKDHIL